MAFTRVIGDLRDLRRGVSELFDNDDTAEEAASYQLAASAYRFSKNAKEVVDDKLSFSATLMRAGEVQAANRLLEEVEHEVRVEEAALIESVNEVKVAQSMRSERITRVRLAKMLAVATVGSALLTFSAAGMAVVGFLKDLTQQSRDDIQGDAIRFATNGNAAAATGPISRRSLRRLNIGNVKVLLTKSQFERLKQLTGGGDISEDSLDELLAILPVPLAQRIEEALAVAQAEVDEVSTTLENVAIEAPKVDKKKKRAARAAEQAAEENEAEPQPSEQASPEPSGSGEDSSQQEEGGDNPLPIKP